MGGREQEQDRRGHGQRFTAVLTLLRCVQLFVAPWTVACQASLSMGFPREDYWSGVPFPSPGDLPDPQIEPVSPALAGRFFTTEPPGKLVILEYSQLTML